MKIAGNDPSIGAKEESDYTALAVIYVTRKDESYRYYICDLVNEHLSQDKRIRMVDNKHTVHKFRTVFVEAIAGFKDYCAELKRQTNVPVKEIDWVKDKITNLENNSSKFETGKVFISKAIPDKLRNELVYQLTTNIPRKDDMRDAVLVALNGVNDSGRVDFSRISLGGDTMSSKMEW
jgi:predicted phage terminase large subunit-like protein